MPRKRMKSKTEQGACDEIDQGLLSKEDKDRKVEKELDNQVDDLEA